MGIEGFWVRIKSQRKSGAPAEQNFTFLFPVTYLGLYESLQEREKKPYIFIWVFLIIKFGINKKWLYGTKKFNSLYTSTVAFHTTSIILLTQLSRNILSRPP